MQKVQHTINTVKWNNIKYLGSSSRFIGMLKAILMKTTILTIVALWILSYPNQASANQVSVAGVEFQQQKTIHEVPLRLQGSGLFKYLSFIKVVAGSLYLLEEHHGARVFEDVPKNLEFEYFVSIKAKDFADATHEGIKRNVSARKYKQVYDRIERFNTFYRNVQPGNRYSLSYIPGKGTSLALNGVELGTVEGADFASAIFTIWLGEKDPMDDDFRLALLNREK